MTGTWGWPLLVVESSWNVMAHGDAREGKWRGNWRMKWVANTLHTPTEHGVSSITTADAHTSAARGRLNWRPRRFKWTRPFRRKTKSGFCACAITFQLASTEVNEWSYTYACPICLGTPVVRSCKNAGFCLLFANGTTCFCGDTFFLTYMAILQLIIKTFCLLFRQSGIFCSFALLCSRN